MYGRLIFALADAACFGQEFEVVSIRPNNSMSGHSSSHSDKERLTAINVSLRNLIVQAYGVKDYQIAGPDWLKSEHFDVAAKFPEPLPEDPDKYAAAMQSMMQKMLADRFKFAAHRDQRMLTVYALAVGKKGIRFQAVPKGRSSSNSNNTRYTGTSISMDRFASFLSTRLDLPVIDKTGLQGYYDLKLDWIPERDMQSKGDVREAPAGQVIQDAIQDQLGLRLERRTARIGILIVDHAEKIPTEN
jgi:uncharacterized protein (TIGR03435 family)